MWLDITVGTQEQVCRNSILKWKSTNVKHEFSNSSNVIGRCSVFASSFLRMLCRHINTFLSERFHTHNSWTARSEKKLSENTNRLRSNFPQTKQIHLDFYKCFKPLLVFTFSNPTYILKFRKSTRSKHNVWNSTIPIKSINHGH